MIAGLEIPHGKNEYDAAGGLLGEPVQVILGPEDRPADPGARRDRVRGLHPSQRQDRRRPARRMDRLLRRRLEEGAGDPRRDHDVSRRSDPARRHPRHPAGRRLVLSRLATAPARCGTSSKPPACRRCKGVWSHAAGGSRLWLTVSIKQMYAGHSKQAGLIASQCHAGAYVNRFVVVVDDDIDPGRHGQGDLGDVHALRSARGHGDSARLLVVGARPDGLWRERPAQRPRRHRRLQAVRPPRHVPARWCARARRSRTWCAASSARSCRRCDVDVP